VQSATLLDGSELRGREIKVGRHHVGSCPARRRIGPHHAEQPCALRRSAQSERMCQGSKHIVAAGVALLAAGEEDAAAAGATMAGETTLQSLRCHACIEWNCFVHDVLILPSRACYRYAPRGRGRGFRGGYSPY
jgi:hypothetical protein